MPTTRGAWEAHNVNAFETTLTSQANALDLTFYLQATTGLTAPFYMVLDPDDASAREYVYVDGNITSTSVTTSDIANRYLDGSAETGGLAHIPSTKVRIVPTKQHFEDIWEALGKVVDVDYSSGTKGTIKGTDIKTALPDLDINDLAASTIVNESEGIASNDNDTTLPTSAAVKDYVDNNGGGITATEDVTLQNKRIQDIRYKVSGITFTSPDSIAIDYSEGVRALLNFNSITVPSPYTINTINFTNIPTQDFAEFELYVKQHATIQHQLDLDTITINGGSSLAARIEGNGTYTTSSTGNTMDLLKFRLTRIQYEDDNPLVEITLDYR